MNEQWKPVVGYEGIYEVSTLGKIRYFKKGEPRLRSHNYSNRSGYPSIPLYKKVGKQKCHSIHRLVAAAFIGDPTGLEVNHKDGNKKNNDVDNLELVTRSQNLIHRVHVLGMKPIRIVGSEHYFSKLSEESVLAIRAGYVPGDRKCIMRLARQFGMSKSAITHIVKRHNWCHI